MYLTIRILVNLGKALTSSSISISKSTDYYSTYSSMYSRNTSRIVENRYRFLAQYNLESFFFFFFSSSYYSSAHISNKWDMLALSSMYFLNMKYEMCISKTTAVRIHINHQCPLQHRREVVCCCLLESSTKWCARYFQYFLVRLGRYAIF